MEQELSPQNNNQVEVPSELRKKIPAKVKWALLGSLVTLLVVVIAWASFSVLTKKPTEVIPVPNSQSSQSTSIPSPQNPSNNITQPNNNLFSPDKISSVFPVLKNRKAYYLKNGDVWVADLAQTQNNTKLLLDIKEKILSFDISNNQDFLAYSVKRNSSTDDEFSGKYGDTILVRNLTNSSEFELYSDKNSADMQIRSILFAPDDKQLFFSNNSIWLANLATKNLQKYATKEKNSFCSIYYLQDISMDGQHILARNGCYEGSSQVVFNATAGKVEGTFNNGYVGGGVWALGFVTNNSLLANNDKGREETENPVVRLGVYDLSGKLIKQIRETNASPLYFDNKSFAGKIFVSLPSNKPTIKGQSVYELNSQTFILSEILSKKDIVAVLYDNAYSVWLTDTVLGNPIFVDSSVKAEKYIHLKLK